jgi:hypothetical protein
MQNLVESLQTELEERGEYVVLANIGWFAVFPNTWRARVETATGFGREGPNLIVYRNRSENPRDHHVIPYAIVRNLLVESTLTYSEVNGSTRWNLVIKDHLLRVTHGNVKHDVKDYFGISLLTEELEIALPEEIKPAQIYWEGSVRQIQINAYERDREARRKCIEHHGMRCVVCKMSFFEVFGPDAASIIHVHHLLPLHLIGKQYAIDPITDLCPVCPNCHAVIHSRYPEPYSIEDVKRRFRGYSYPDFTADDNHDPSTPQKGFNPSMEL